MMNFNSCSPHGEQSVFILDSTIPYIISIHAPAWGAIFEAINQDIPIYFSIHAPRVRSDATFLKWCMACLRFQFSLPAWEAIVLAGLLVVLLVISILASAWGATFASRPSSARGRFFNSRSPWGERLSISFKAPTILSFQFTLLE